MTREEALNKIGELVVYARAQGWDEVFTEAFDTLSAEPCGDAISRQAVLEAFNLSEKTRKYGGDHSGYDTMMLYEIQDVIEDLPSVTSQPKIGRWGFLDECTNSGYYCSECHKKLVKEGWSDTVKKIKFCPNCGAKMAESEGRNAET